jgi:hypothetical protein
MELLVTSLGQIGIGGLFAAALVAIHWHTVRVLIPAIVQAFREELSAQRNQNTHDLDKLGARLDRMADKCPCRLPLAPSKDPA